MILKQRSTALRRDRGVRLPFGDRSADKRRKGVFFEPEFKTYRWVLAKDR